MTVSAKDGLKVFYSYSHKDEPYKDQLEEHLAILKQQGFISDWHDRRISAGHEWEKEIDQHLEAADIVLLLISSSFFASGYCTAKELIHALDKHESGTARVIPIIVRPVDWHESLISKLQVIPKDALPVTDWPNQDNAWVDVARSIRQVVEEIKQDKQRQVESKKPTEIVQLLTQEVTRIDEIFKRDATDYGGVPTGYRGIDEKIDGLKPGDLFVIGALHSVDKTDFALNITQSVAIQTGQPVAAFCMRTSALEATHRFLSSTGKLNYHRQLRGRLEDTEWESLTYALAILNEAHLYLDDSPTLSIKTIDARCRKLLDESGHLGLIVIDSLQHLAFSADSDKSAAETGRALKIMARELNVPIITTSQVSRSTQLRMDKRPVLSDLGDWYGIEDEADVVVFLNRNEIANNGDPRSAMIEAIIAKNTRGPLGVTHLKHLPEQARFEDASVFD